jgi:DNA-binding CsgD family transcriptional regulator
MGEKGIGMKNRSKRPPKKKLRCHQCGAIAARNGNPFTPFTLRVHQARMHRAEKMAGEPLLCNLTRRQQQILERIAAGKREREVAAELSLSPHTVHHHVRTIYTKLGLKNRAEAVQKWMSETNRASRPAAPMPAQRPHFCPNCGCHLTAMLPPPLPFIANAAAGLNGSANRISPNGHV